MTCNGDMNELLNRIPQSEIALTASKTKSLAFAAFILNALSSFSKPGDSEDEILLRMDVSP